MLFAALTVMSSSAQQSSDARSSFEDFRKGLLNNYNSFREGILADYAKFLDGVWVEYSGFKGVERDETPKPVTPPAVEPVGTTDPKVELTPKEAPATPEKTQETPVTNPVADVPAKTPATTASDDKFGFDFHGLIMEVPQIEIRLMESVSRPADFANQWRALDSNDESKKLVSEIEALAKKHNFNDYLTYDLATAYTTARYPKSSPASRTSLVHYIMTHLGYDARLSVSDQGQALLLLPTVQTLYSRTFLNINNSKYYVFTDPAVKLSPSDMSFYTCDLPAAASQASKFDMRIKPLNIPYEPHPYNISYGGLEIKGETNAKLYPLLYKYPQTSMGAYADSEVMPDVRRDIVAQLKKQLEGKDKAEAVDQLLQFVQSGFEYATDQQLHGFEKPYFFEEILFYPQCDCEDRAIFYTYLVWNVLGVESHLLMYPGHESASVSLPGRSTGDAYRYDGQTFLISDPTYIGSKTGMCMPNYKTTTPEIDYVYK